MTGAAKGMAGLLAALALIGGLAFWLLKDDGGALGNAGRRQTAAPSDAAAQADAASAAPNDGAKRSAEEAPVAAESAESTEGKLPPGTPTAEYLAGLVVDHAGRPVADAEVSFAASTFGPRMRGRNSSRIRMSLFQTGPEIPAMTARTGADGKFRLAHVPRLEGFDLSVDHPDYVFQRRAGVVVPARGMDVGKITLEQGGTVAGQVFGPGGARVANAEVWLEDAQDDNNPFRFFSFGATARGERKTVTDEQGRFRLTGMPAGKCVAAAKTDVFPENTSAQVDLKANDELRDLVVNLESGDRITGTVKGPDGKPVADAEIHLNQNNRGFSMSFAGRRMPFEPATKSDADGRFEVKALKRGVYEVSVVAKAFAVKNVTDVDSSAGAPLDITLSAGAHVAGMVRLKETQEPARNVKVQLMRVFGDQVMPTSLDFPPDSDNTATQDGAFVIAEVDPGTYRVIARGDDTTRASSANFEVAEGQSIDNVEVTVERGAVVEGRVVDASTGAPVANVDVEAAVMPQEGAAPGPRGRAGVRVETVLAGPGGRRIFGGGGSRQAVARAKSDANGRFELKNLGNGTIQIDTRHADYATTRSAPMELKAGERKSGVDLAIGRGGAIEGAVTGLDGKPRVGDRIDVVSKSIEGVGLHAVTDGDGLYRVDHVPAGEGIVERSEGESNDGRRPTFRAIMAVEGNNNEQEPGKPFSLKEGDTARVDFTQQEKPYVEGVVRSASGPVAGVTVSASSSGGRRGGNFILGGGGKTATTAADGSYRLTDLEPGSYRISARHSESIVPVRESVELKSGEPARVDFFLEGGVIEGDVLAQKNHAKLEGALVSLQRIDPEGANQNDEVAGTFAFSIQGPGRARGGRSFAPIRFGDDMNSTQVMSDSNGHFRVPWVPAGKWKVSVSHSGFLSTTSEEIAVAANARVEGVKLEMPVAAQLIVHLKSKGTGQALQNAPVELSTEDGGHDFGVTDEDGAAHFDSLKPGTWTVTGRKTFGGPGNAGANDGQKKTVETPAGQTTEITIDV